VNDDPAFLAMNLQTQLFLLHGCHGMRRIAKWNMSRAEIIGESLGVHRRIQPIMQIESRSGEASSNETDRMKARPYFPLDEFKGNRL
jgi:hypothetical protein